MSEQGRASGRRADRTGTTRPGRRGVVRRHRLDVFVVLAVLLPLAVGGALVVVGDAEDPAPWADAPPSPARLTHASLVCPAASSSTAGDVVLSRVPGTSRGAVDVSTAEGDATELAGRDRVVVAPGRPARVASDGDVLVTGKAAGAPGLVAGRTGPARAAAECRPPTFDEWYVGIGAGAKHSTTVELANPDEGPAVVEIALYGRPGLIEEPELRGIRVPGHQVLRLDLSRITPRRGTLAAHVVVVRGRVTTTVRHTYDPLGRGAARVDFLPAQAEPGAEALLLGVPADAVGKVHLFNPGEDELRATVRVVSDKATFTPAGLDDVVVPSGKVRQVSLSQVLTEDTAGGALGLQVVSSEPLLASTRVLGDDLGAVAPAVPVAEGEPATVVVPEGPKRLVLAGATRTGVVRLTAVDARGQVVVDDRRLEVGADRAQGISVPDDAVLVTVTAQNTDVAGTVMLTGDRVGVLRLRPAEILADVPVVRPE